MTSSVGLNYLDLQQTPEALQQDVRPKSGRIFRRIPHLCDICGTTEAKRYHTHFFKDRKLNLCRKDKQWFLTHRYDLSKLSFEEILSFRKSTHTLLKGEKNKNCKEWLNQKGMESPYNLKDLKLLPDTVENRDKANHLMELVFMNTLSEKNVTKSKKSYEEWSCIRCKTTQTGMRKKGLFTATDFCNRCGEVWKRFIEGRSLTEDKLETRKRVISLLESSPTQKMKNPMSIESLLN